MKTNYPYRSWLTIDTESIQHNFKTLQSFVTPQVSIISIIKSNAYQLGIVPIAQALTASGANIFGVAQAQEAITLREQGIEGSLLLLSDPLPEEIPSILDYEITATISCEPTLSALATIAEKYKKTLSVQLKIDTGMGRLGTWHTQSPLLYQKIKQSPYLKLTGIYTHLPVAGTDQNYTEAQKKTFLNALQKMPHLDHSQTLIHADISPSLSYFKPTFPFNAVRIGSLLFNFKSHIPLWNHPLKSVFSLHAKIALIKTLPIKTGISYGLTHVLTRPSRVAIVSIGYADGIRRSLTNGYVLIHGERCPILGLVCMDQMTVDVTDLKTLPQRGDTATLIGQQEKNEITLETFCQFANITPLEAVCGFSQRIKRIYL